MSPAVGSIRRISVRTSVDLPEPERPMTTKTSPGMISSETSRTAIVQPVFCCSSRRESSASSVPMIWPAFAPKIFHTPCARRSGSPAGTATPSPAGASPATVSGAWLMRRTGDISAP